ncbi:MAG: hypothetical protein ACMUIU_13590 [bacterium]
MLEDKGRGLESKAAELYDIDGIFEEGISKESFIEEGTKDISISGEAAEGIIAAETIKVMVRKRTNDTSNPLDLYSPFISILSNSIESFPLMKEILMQKSLFCLEIFRKPNYRSIQAIV